MLINELQEHLKSIDSISNEDWMNSLTPRKMAELEFHNRDRDVEFATKSKANDTYEKFYGNRKYYSATKSQLITFKIGSADTQKIWYF